MSTQKDHANGFNWSELNQPRILSPDQWENNQYLLFEELNRCFKTIKEFSSSHEEYKRNRKHSVPFELPMNIGIIGDRGTGKTSILKSLKLKLEKENYFVFDIMDPNTLSSELTILEILISNIYHHVVEQNLHPNNCSSFECNTTRIMQLFKKIMSTLAIKRQKSDFLKKDNPDIEIVEKISDIVNLDQIIVNLLDTFIEYERSRRNGEKYTDLVLIIDDLDLTENKYAHKLISEIQEYLNTKMIIVLAYNNKQLEESILENKIRNNQLLLDEKVVEVNTLRKQTEHLLLKLIASNNRIYLYNQSELLGKQYIEVFKSLGIDEKLLYEMLNDYHLHYEPAQDEKEAKKINIEDWFYNRVQYLTKIYIKPVNEKEPANMLLPSNLREIVHFVNLLTKSKNPTEDVSNSSDRVDFNNLIFNLNLFKEYFLAKSQHILEHRENELLDSWLFSDSHQKNHLAYKYFFDRSEDFYYRFHSREKDSSKNAAEKTQENAYIDLRKYPFNLVGVENYNLRLGDVYAIMELFSRYIARSPEDFYVVYFFKVLYSLEMTSLLIQSFQHLAEKEKSTPDFHEIITLDLLTDEINYFLYKTLLYGEDKQKYQNESVTKTKHSELEKETDPDILKIKNSLNRIVESIEKMTVNIESIIKNNFCKSEQQKKDLFHFFKKIEQESESLEKSIDGGLTINPDKRESVRNMIYYFQIELNQKYNKFKKFTDDLKEIINKLQESHLEHNTNLVKYIKLLNTSFMPNDFNYFSYTSEQKEDVYYVFNPNQSFIDYFITSKYGSKGDVIQGFTMNQSMFKYRPIYELKRIVKKGKRNDLYTIELYVPFTKTVNIITTLSEYVHPDDKEELGFLFYSMFQIDCFVRKNTARRSEKSPLKYALNKINQIFQPQKSDYNAFRINDEYLRPIINSHMPYGIPYPKDKIDMFNNIYSNKKIKGSTLSKLYTPKFTFEIVGNIENTLEGVTVMFPDREILIKEKNSIKEIVEEAKRYKHQFSDVAIELLEKLENLPEYNNRSQFGNPKLRQCTHEFLEALEVESNEINKEIEEEEDENENA